MRKHRIFIVDDEAPARQRLGMLLSDIQDSCACELTGEAGSAQDALDAIMSSKPDIVLLDIQMPGMEGFEVSERVVDVPIPAIIFVTAFDQYALKAFDVHALDYLLKPFSDARFEEALAQAKSQIELRELHKLSEKLLALLRDRPASEEAALTPDKLLTRFMIKSAGRITFLKAADVDWIAADDYYVKLHTPTKSHLLRLSMNELEERLDPRTFLRIHRSTIVNLDRIKELHQDVNGEYLVVLQDGTELKLSRARRDRLEELLGAGQS